MLLTLLFTCLAFMALVTSGFSTGWIVGLSRGRYSKPSSHHQWWPWTSRFHRRRRADEVQSRRWRAAASGQLSGSRAQIWLRHGACPILPSEHVGMSHSQFRPPQQCRDCLTSFPMDELLNSCNSFRSCAACGSQCVCHQLICDRSWTGHAIETHAHDSSFGPRRVA